MEQRKGALTGNIRGQHTRHSSNHFFRNAALLLVSIVGLILLISGGSVYVVLGHSLRQDQAEAEGTARNLSEILSTHLWGAVNEVDVVMQSAADEIGRQRAGDKIAAAKLDAYLARQQSFLPQIISLRVTDAEGNVRYGPGVRQAAPTNVADRSYFILQRERDGAGLVFGEPVFARISKQWVLPISRRYNNPGGSFAGVVYANIAVDFLSRTFANIDMGPNGAVSLLTANRKVVARFPPKDAAGSFVGRQASSPAIVALMEEKKKEAVYQTEGSLDGIVRTYSLKKIGDYPLYIHVGLARQDYLAGWHRQRQVALFGYTVFALFLLTAAALLLRAWNRQYTAVRGLIESRQKEESTLSELKISVAVQKATAARLELVLETAAEGIVGIDAAGIITFANSEAARLLDFVSAAEMLGIVTEEAFHHRLADGRQCKEGFCSIRETLMDGETRRVADECFETLKGRKVHIEYVVAPFKYEDKVAGSVLVFHDIGGRIAMEDELKRSNAELEQFAYAASHDLREPLRMVISFVGLLERKFENVIDPEAREFIGYARDGAKRMDRMIHHLLEYSRIGRSKEPFVPVELGEVVAEAISNLGALVGEADAKITVADGMPCVAGDRGSLVSLFQNLIANALKYRDKNRRPEIEVGCEKENDTCRIFVRDNGIGIAPEHRERVFAIFQRLHTQNQYEGTGIGLALCKKVVERHGGRIWIEGEPGRGSIIFFTLPTATS